MAMPHAVFKRKCENELKGLSGEKRANKVDCLLGEMSGYKSGPYAEVRKWLFGQKDKAIISKRVLNVEHWEVKKQGHFTFALIGFPSVGKSSLIKALTGAQIQVADYDFTTIRPFSAVAKINGASIQLVDLPGIIEGASEGRGFGRRVLGNALNADKLLLVVDSSAPEQLQKVIRELAGFGFEVSKKNACVVFTKNDLARPPGCLLESVSISIHNQFSLEEFKQFLFLQSSLIRVFPFNSHEPVILHSGAKVEDFCNSIHKGIKSRFRHALICGPSARFGKQQVGLAHELKDLDVAELVLNR
jgi:small GTP-binding protein